MNAVMRVESTRGSSLGVRAATTATVNEIHKGLIHAWSERLQIMIELPLLVVSLLLFALLVGRGQQIASGHVDWQFDPKQVSTVFIGYVAFSFFYLQSAKLFWRLLGEIQAGTLEQVYLSPLPAWLVATAGRVVATVLETAVVVGVLYVAVFVIAPVHLTWSPLAAVPIRFIVVGSVGYSLIEGGMVLAWKRVEMVHELATGMMIFFSGALIPLDRMPAWMAEIGRLSPIGESVTALRAVLIDGQQSFPLGGDGRSLWLFAIAVAYLAAGIVAFSLGERVARRQGSIGGY